MLFAQLQPIVPCILIVKERAMGPTRSANQALQSAVQRGHDVVIINADALVSPGTLTEMCQVADLDSMIGFVSPRSNNPTICSLRHDDRLTETTPSEAYAAFRELSAYLPPIPVCSCGSRVVLIHQMEHSKGIWAFR